MKDVLIRTPTFTTLTMRRVVMALFAAILSVVPFHAVRAQTPPDLGAAANFAVLAGTTITCTSAIIIGDVGVNLGGSVGACTVVGTTHVGDALAVQAYGDFLTAYAALSGVPCDATVNGTLAGLTLAPGVYCLDPSAKTGLLTLNGPPNGIWIFKTESSALTATSFQVVFSGGAPACTGGGRVFWWSSSGATFTDSNFMGTVLAGTSATVTNGNFNGQLLAKFAVTLTTPGSFNYCAPVPPIIPCPAITVSPANLPKPVVGVAYNQVISASGGTGPYTFAVTSGTLPAGLALSSGGVLSGTPTTAGISNFTVTATDASACKGNKAYVVVVNPAACPTILLQPSSLPNGTAGQVYSQTITASGGMAPYTFAVTLGTLPAGLSLSSGGVLSGTPTAQGTSAFSVTATDFNGCMGVQPYTLLIACPVITLSPAILPAATAGMLYTQTISSSGGTGPYSFVVTSGTLPLGLTLSSGGVLSGTPTMAGSSTFTVTATDASNCTGDRTYVMIVNPAPCATILLQPSSLPNGSPGEVYSQTFTASGGMAPYTFTVTHGTLPAGLSLSSGGVLSGIPLAQGTRVFTVTATDFKGCLGAQVYTLVIACPVITLSPASLPDGMAGVFYNQTIFASGGAGPYSFAVTVGSLFPGLTLSPAGVLSGTPTAQGTRAFSVTATDANGCIGARAYTLFIACPAISLSPASLPGGNLGMAYNQALVASGGMGPYSFAVTLGSLSPGLTLSSAGALSGTPTALGTRAFTVTATDAYGCAGSRAYTLVISCPAITLSPSSLPNGTSGLTYNQVITAGGGMGPYTFARTLGNLPVGLMLSSGGVLSGTPTVAGTYNFTVTATDAYGCTGSRAYTLVIACPSITLLPSSLPSGVTGLTYNQIITASGGTGPYTFSVTSGNLPVGLTFSSGGVLSGTPMAAGTFNFTVRAADANGCAGSRAYLLAIACPAITLSPASLPVGTVGLAYSQTITASGGTGPYTFAVALGNLPAGLALSPGGVLSGAPTTAGIFNFSVTATDRNGCAGARAYVGTMVNPPVIIHMRTTPPCVTPFKIFVKGSNFQPGIKVYIDGVEWYAVTWKNTGKIVLKGAIHAAVPPGRYHTFTFVNPDGGVATKTWRYMLPAKPCGS